MAHCNLGLSGAHCHMKLETGLKLLSHDTGDRYVAAVICLWRQGCSCCHMVLETGMQSLTHDTGTALQLLSRDTGHRAAAAVT